jgi:DNA-binding response OmpR family regulator
MMPDMDGFVLYNEIRKQTDVPVIFVSAKNQVNEAVYSLRDPQTGYLSKPFHIDDLIFCVKRILKVTGPLPELAV